MNELLPVRDNYVLWEAVYKVSLALCRSHHLHLNGTGIYL